jgi:hypothetical protein
MTQRDLHTLLTDLHNQLHAAQGMDPESRRRLRLVAEDIRAFVAAGPKPRDAGKSQDLRDRLAKLVVAFEGSHPDLSKTIENVVDTLSLHSL